MHLLMQMSDYSKQIFSVALKMPELTLSPEMQFFLEKEAHSLLFNVSAAWLYMLRTTRL